MIRRCQKTQASPPVGIAPSGWAETFLGLNPRIGRGARSNLSKYEYVAPSGAPFGVFVPLTCVSLARRRRSLVLGSGPRMTGRGSGCGAIRDDASAWPVAREVPAGWCTNPTGTLARGMFSDHWRSSTIPAVLSAPPPGCSRRRGRLVCVPLRHVLPIGGFRRRASDRPPSLPPPRPEGDRCSGPGLQVCDNSPPRRRPRLA